MRTTITVDDNLYHRLESVAERSQRSFKDVLNETIKAGLSTQYGESDDLHPFIVEAVDSRIKPGIDESRFNAYIDELESEDFLSKQEPS